ncbi:hypothetical protein [Pelagicoccus albus]|uniref:Uncharacterized protein n=1 Tax=Pelagicoccus albus TaxID=415222 RepID=A0A7X1B7B4_9BACT|nr:hypothetical protein [Pelagicoccus albus]MBC2607000.1 hypothetical protein [Pelagicoccus albus]
MKDSKTILNRQVALSLLFQILIVALLALPQLDEYRQQLAEITKLPTSAFWIPLLGILLLGNFLILSRIGTSLVEPLEELVDQTRMGAATIAFHKKSKNAEEDHLKHFIESQSLRTADMEQEIVRMENEVDRISELAKTSPEEIDALRMEIANLQSAKEDSDSQILKEQTNAAGLEKELIAIRRELKMRNRELETVRNESAALAKETAEDGRPMSVVLAEKLKTPLNVIRNLAGRLSQSWEDTPPSQIRDGLEEISKQSEEQFAVLKKYVGSVDLETEETEEPKQTA